MTLSHTSGVMWGTGERSPSKAALDTRMSSFAEAVGYGGAQFVDFVIVG